MPTIVDALKMRYPNAKGSTIVDVLKSINDASVGDTIDVQVLNGKGKTNYYYDGYIQRLVFEVPNDPYTFTRFAVMNGDTVMGYAYKYEFDEEVNVTNPPTEGEACLFNFAYSGKTIQQTGRFCTNDGLTYKDKYDGVNCGKPLCILGGESNASVKTIYLFFPNSTDETLSNLGPNYYILTPVEV